MDDIDWQSLRHAYGSADDVPDRLLSLADGDDSAIGELLGNIYHQGSVYQASLRKRLPPHLPPRPSPRTQKCTNKATLSLS